MRGYICKGKTPKRRQMTRKCPIQRFTEETSSLRVNAFSVKRKMFAQMLFRLKRKQTRRWALSCILYVEAKQVPTLTCSIAVFEQ